MRTTFLILLLSACFLSCKKDGLGEFKKDLSGTWEIRSSATYSGTITYAPGNGEIIVIGKNGNFERKQHDTLLFRGSYSLSKRQDCHGDDLQVFFTTTEPNSGELIVSTSDSTLSFGNSNCLSDGAYSSFRRIGN